ncbi:MAG: glutamate-1-semialdehyde 2,1-aminomutase [Candidatus Azotimanducaceae bacterium]|jgi:glutamate-1-semialdehyde 2,1-aminomutase
MMDLDHAVQAARTAYAAARPQSAGWADRARRVMPGGNTRSVLQFEPFPFRVERAHGRLLFDIDGYEYLDLLGNYTAGLLGHSPEPVLAAVRAALERGWSLGSVHSDEVRLAELIVDRFPSIDQVRFTNSGTEANLMALAVATHHTGRSKIVVFENGYHGGVITFGSGPNPVNVPHDWLILPYNDRAAFEAAMAEHGDRVAAVLVEPMQGSGGCIPGDPDFLAVLRSASTQHGSVLIFDEVMTSRLAVGGAQEQIGITPDMTTLGKYLAGGLSFGAFGGRDDLMAAFDPRRGGTLGHAGTFNNNVASMAGGVAALTEVLTADVLHATNHRGDDLRNRLNAVFADRQMPMCVTGVGSLMNLHGIAGPVNSANDLADADDRLKELLFFHLLAVGIYTARRGFIALSIEITDEDVDRVVTAVEMFCSASSYSCPIRSDHQSP